MKTTILYFGILGLIIIWGCGGPATQLANDARVLYDEAQYDLGREKYVGAVEKFQRIVYNFPGATFIDTAQYLLAQSYFGNEEFELAAVEFGRLVSNYPQSHYYDDAQFMTGLCYYKSAPGHYGLDQEDLKLAIAALNNFILDNPESELVPEAEKSVLEARTKLAKKEYENGLLYTKVYANSSARIYFQMVVDEYTETEFAGKALFRLAEIEYKEENFQSAIDKLNHFLNIYEDSELAEKARKYLETISHKTLEAQAPDES